MQKEEEMREGEGEREKGGGGGREIIVLRSRNSCQIVCNTSTPPVSVNN